MIADNCYTPSVFPTNQLLVHSFSNTTDGLLASVTPCVTNQGICSFRRVHQVLSPSHLCTLYCFSMVFSMCVELLGSPHPSLLVLTADMLSVLLERFCFAFWNIPYCTPTPTLHIRSTECVPFRGVICNPCIINLTLVTH